MTPTLKERLLLVFFALVVLSISLSIHTRHNRFPYYYHPDEPGKAEQLIKGNWNFNHPMLLLSTTRGLATVFGTVREVGQEQAMIELARTVSAAFMAAAVALLSILAWCWRGWWLATITAGALCFHQQLYELSHYAKEDGALLMGLSAALLALQLYWWQPNWFRAGLLGGCCALAISGKYIGATILVAVVPLLLWRAQGRRWKILLIWLAALLVALAVINAPLIADFGRFRASLDREVGLVVEGQGGLTRKVPHAIYWSVFLDNSTPVIWVLILVFFFARIREWRLPQRKHARLLDAAQRTAVGLPILWAIMLSFVPKENDRYFLPASALFTFIAAVGVDDAMRLLGARVDRRVSLSVLGGLLILGQCITWHESRPGWFAYDRAFQQDDNADLIKYLREHVAADAVIAKDNRVALPDPKRKSHAWRVGVIPQKVYAAKYAADLGGIEDQQEKLGVTHVIVSSSDYGRFFRAGLKPQAGKQADKFIVQRNFYEELFSGSHELLWERERGTIIYLHPGIRVYRLRPAGKIKP